MSKIFCTFARRMRAEDNEEADSFLNVAAEQGYKPAVKTQECFKDCRGEEIGVSE